MTWTAPEVDRLDEALAGAEWTMLTSRLDRNRTTLLHKCAGLTAAQLAERAVPPSDLSLLGLLRHLTDVERIWFRTRFAGQPVDWAYGPPVSIAEADPATAEEDYARLVAEQELCRQAVTGRSLDDTYPHEQWGPLSLRWMFGHVTEEYARHCGHADLLRERIDGVTGA
ncbi:MAG TPA: DUF664 domain-containing protein [Pseudonocardiaceae bacterium]|nr:DUF664 domain-containing protein [Pseudonocardiaceae bacterium]